MRSQLQAINICAVRGRPKHILGAAAERRGESGRHCEERNCARGVARGVFVHEGAAVQALGTYADKLLASAGHGDGAFKFWTRNMW